MAPPPTATFHGFEVPIWALVLALGRALVVLFLARQADAIGPASYVLEPVFEADFDVDSYGFRPRRDAHQALAAIRESVAAGMTWVVGADVSKCFDTIRTTSS